MEIKQYHIIIVIALIIGIIKLLTIDTTIIFLTTQIMSRMSINIVFELYKKKKTNIIFYDILRDNYQTL